MLHESGTILFLRIVQPVEIHSKMSISWGIATRVSIGRAQQS